MTKNVNSVITHLSSHSTTTYTSLYLWNTKEDILHVQGCT